MKEYTQRDTCCSPIQIDSLYAVVLKCHRFLLCENSDYGKQTEEKCMLVCPKTEIYFQNVGLLQPLSLAFQINSRSGLCAG